MVNSYQSHCQFIFFDQNINNSANHGCSASNKVSQHTTFLILGIYNSRYIGNCICAKSKISLFLYVMLSAPEEKTEPPQAMNALMRLNQLKPGLQYKLVSQTGPVHVPVFTMAVEVDGTTFEASGPSKRTAKLHVAVKVKTIKSFQNQMDATSH